MRDRIQSVFHQLQVNSKSENFADFQKIALDVIKKPLVGIQILKATLKCVGKLVDLGIPI